ncbi:predicted protein [Lichtheimia corymbifera JMRC:FSU:9682]|uniref:Uncharacterized protein n=1 Tax=Lichtheimia corymbifera JMRC:FSU:9682 TaxID=1263082 RepID=A0A068RXF0_9FUNG|nr:predicted protein [Lichtheimia corymbifera JMRC:FSU:9682]
MHGFFPTRFWRVKSSTLTGMVVGNCNLSWTKVACKRLVDLELVPTGRGWGWLSSDLLVGHPCEYFSLGFRKPTAARLF